ncbi:MAG: hypothetical protein V1929_04325 [bacterium]
MKFDRSGRARGPSRAAADRDPPSLGNYGEARGPPSHEETNFKPTHYLLLPDDVARELFAPPAEVERLKGFLKASCRVVSIRPRGFQSVALSIADRAVLTLAARERAGWVLSDDRLLRDLAEVEGMRPLGTLGFLLLALRRKRLTASETRVALDDLVRLHGFRSGVELYRAAVRMIDDATL